MRRFSSLKQVPAETRSLLRDRFARYLPLRHSTAIRTAGTVTLADESLLHLLLSLSIDFASDVDRARAIYEAALPSNSGEPSLEDLILAGWIRVVWGRISTPFEIAQAARTAPTGTMTALATLLAKRFEQVYRLTDAAHSSADLVDVVAAIDRGELAPRNIGCLAPEWVAARLWDRPLTDFTDLSAALRVWIDRWEQLGCPSLVPGRVWTETAANAFRQAAMDVLASEPGLVDWDEMRAGILKQMALPSKQSPSSMEGYVPPVPATLVDRALWLDDHRIERAVMGTFDFCGDIFGLARLLLAEVQAEDHAPAPRKIASKLFASGDRTTGTSPHRAHLGSLEPVATRGHASLPHDIRPSLLADRAMEVGLRCLGSGTEHPRRPNDKSYRVRRRRISHGGLSRAGFSTSGRGGIVAELDSSKRSAWLHGRFGEQ